MGPTSKPRPEEGFVRNKVEYERSIRRLREMQRSGSMGPDDDVSEILSSLRGTNMQNEETIRSLQRDLVRVTRNLQRDIARLTEEREAARGECEELKDELRRERLAFARASHRSQKQAEGWKRRAASLEERCSRLERELKRRRKGAPAGDEEAGAEEAGERKSEADGPEKKRETVEKELGEKDAAITLWKGRQAEEKGELVGEADATASPEASSGTVTTADTSPSASFEDPQLMSRPDREWAVSSHGSYVADIALQGAADVESSTIVSEESARAKVKEGEPTASASSQRQRRQKPLRRGAIKIANFPVPKDASWAMSAIERPEEEPARDTSFAAASATLAVRSAHDGLRPEGVRSLRRDTPVLRASQGPGEEAAWALARHLDTDSL